MSRVGSDHTTRTDDRTADRKRETQSEEARRRQQERTRRSLTPTDGIDAPPTTTAAGDTGAIAKAGERFAGLGLFAEGLTADSKTKTTDLDGGAAANGALNVGEMGRAFGPLADLIVDSPPEGVEPAPAFTVDNAIPLSELHLNPKAERRGVEFNAVFSGAEKSVVLRAFAKVYDRQLTQLQQPAGARGTRVPLTPEQEKVRQQFVQVTGATFRKAGITADDLVNATPGSAEETPPPADGQGPTVDADKPPAQGAASTGTPATQPTTDGPAMAKANQTNGMPQDGKVYAIPSLLDRLNKAGGDFSALGKNLQADAGMDIDALVQMVMLEVADDQEKELRVMAEKMQKMNEAKKKQRDLQATYREAKTALEGEMRQEFEELKHSGVIGDGVTFEEYTSWRQVVVGAPKRDGDGVILTDATGRPVMSDPCLPQPSPPTNLPPFLTDDKKGVDGSDGSISSAATQMAKDFGVTDDQIKMLHDYYFGYFADEYGEKNDDTFKSWLANNVGLVTANNMEDVEANNAAIRAYLDELKADPNIGQDLSSLSSDNVEAIEDILTQLDQRITGLKTFLTQMDAGTRSDLGLPAAPAEIDQAAAMLAMSGNPEYMNIYNEFVTATNDLTRMLKEHRHAYLDDEGIAQIVEMVKDCGTYVNTLGDVGVEIQEDLADFCNADNIFWEAPENGLKARTPPFENADGEKIKVLDTAQVDAWLDVQSEAEAMLGGADLYAFGLSSEDMAVVQQLWMGMSDAERASFEGDIEKFMETALGFVAPDSEQFEPTYNRDRLQSYLDAQIAGASGDELAALQSMSAELKLASTGGLASDQYGITPNYGDALEDLWVQLPDATRQQYEGDFQKFVNAIGMTQGNDGPGNQAKIDAFVADLSEADKTAASQAVAQLELAKTPFDESAFGLTIDVAKFLEVAWQQMPASERAQYNGDINAWVEQGLQLEKASDAGAANMTKLDAWVESNYGVVETEDVNNEESQEEPYTFAAMPGPEPMSGEAAREAGYVFIVIDGVPKWADAAFVQAHISAIAIVDGGVYTSGGLDNMWVKGTASAYDYEGAPPKPGEQTYQFTNFNGQMDMGTSTNVSFDDGGPAQGNMGGTPEYAQSENQNYGTNTNIYLTGDEPPPSSGSNYDPEAMSMAEMWAAAKAGDIEDAGSTDGAPRNEYIDQLIDAGILEEAQEALASSNSNNDAATGDNLITGEKAQNIPPGAEGQMMSIAGLDDLIQRAKDDLDSMSEASELDMLRMQIMMDRRSRAFETLSNILKKAGSTADGIISNLK